MSKYSVTQVGSLAQWANLEGVAPGKKFVEGDLGAQFVGISVNYTVPGAESPFWHTHSVLEEIYVVLDGYGEIALDDEVLPLEPGTIVRVGQGVWRALRCLPDSDNPLKWLCLRAGGDTLKGVGHDGDLDQERAFPWA